VNVANLLVYFRLLVSKTVCFSGYYKKYLEDMTTLIILTMFVFENVEECYDVSGLDIATVTTILNIGCPYE